MERFPFVLTFLFFLFFQISSYAQIGCAGNDATITICNKDQDTKYQTFDLFDELGGTPLRGGVWSTTNPANFYALDRTNGVINLWKVLNSGTHIFTYTNDACGESANVIINLGGYSGEDNIDGSANACSSEYEVNMHRFLGSEVDDKIQDFNGLWEAITPEAINHLEENIFNAFTAGPGVYEFTYTVAAVETCPSEQSRVILEVHPSPNPGQGIALTVCVTDDLSSYRNVNLNNYLVLEDTNGTWSESGTGQLSDLTDNIIDVEDIRDRFGYGSYSFEYTVYPTHPVCDEQSSVVTINILPTLEGELKSTDYCYGEPYTINLSYDNTILPNGEYEIEYTLTPDVGPTRSDKTIVQLINGEAFFDLNNSLVSENTFTTLTITSFQAFSPLRDVCSYFNVTETTFMVSNPKVAIESVCEQTNVPVVISNILDTAGSLTNENHNISYTITSPSSVINTYTIENLNFTDGQASFNIPSEYITETGDFTASITLENIYDSSCYFEGSFTITPTPEAIQLSLIVDNSCDATQIDVVVEAPTLINGVYNVTYDVVEQNSGEVVINNTIEFAGGTANYQVDVAPLEKGNYTISVRSTQNDTTPCRLIFEFEETQNFAVKSIPNIPEGETQQFFCTSEFESNEPTLEDLSFTASGDPLFYATETSDEILNITTPLVDGEDYFVSNIDNENNCEGPQRLRIVTTINSPAIPTTNDVNPFFCGSENAILADIIVSTSNGENVVWFDAASNGNQLPNTTTVENGVHYFAASETTNGCKSESRLEISPTVYNLEPATLSFAKLALCALDKPTVADLVTSDSNDSEIIWYDSPENGNVLTDDIELVHESMYYAESFNTETGCINSTRFAITVDLTDCNPDEYDFYIPDGFSPNGDARNDTYFIPNIEKIFPDFTLEIKNRYGRTMFTGNKQVPAWDGTNNGSSIAPNGVYFYIINYNKEGFEPKQGRLYLNR